MLLDIKKVVIVTIPTKHTIPKTEATNRRLVSKCTAHIESGQNIFHINPGYYRVLIKSCKAAVKANLQQWVQITCNNQSYITGGHQISVFATTVSCILPVVRRYGLVSGTQTSFHH